MKLYIGNKNYSSWSMRPWVLMKQASIPFDEVKVRFDSFEPGSSFKQEITRISGAGRVPVLVDQDVVVWDSLAIAEYLAEVFPEKNLWPAIARDRARARSVCAEMHSGFAALRSACPMNIEASLPEIGERVMSRQAPVRKDLDRIASIWLELLATHGGPLLFGAFTIADAFFAPVVMRIRSYALPVPPAVTAYIERVLDLPSVVQWIDDALAERDFRDFEEPYRSAPGVLRAENA